MRLEKFSAFDQFMDTSKQVSKNKDLTQTEINLSVSDNPFLYKNAYSQPVLKDPEDLFNIGEYGEFDYQTDDIGRDYRNNQISLI